MRGRLSVHWQSSAASLLVFLANRNFMWQRDRWVYSVIIAPYDEAAVENMKSAPVANGIRLHGLAAES